MAYTHLLLLWDLHTSGIYIYISDLGHTLLLKVFVATQGSNGHEHPVSNQELQSFHDHCLFMSGLSCAHTYLSAGPITMYI